MEFPLCSKYVSEQVMTVNNCKYCLPFGYVIKKLTTLSVSLVEAGLQVVGAEMLLLLIKQEAIQPYLWVHFFKTIYFKHEGYK